MYVTHGNRVLPDDAWRRTHVRRLLQLVAASGNASIARTELMKALWPEQDEERARNRLHHTIHLARKAFAVHLGPDVATLVIDGERVSIARSGGIQIDAQEFCAVVAGDDTEPGRPQRVERAIELYRGDFAADWDDCEHVHGLRTYFRQSYRALLCEGADSAVAGEDLQAASTWAERLVLAEPERPDRYRHVLLWLAESGAADSALTLLQQARGEVESELGKEAVAPLDELVKTIRMRANSTPGQGVPALSGARRNMKRREIERAPERLSGRGIDMSLATEVLSDPACLILTLIGPPGVGKSALARELGFNIQASCRDGGLIVDATGAESPEALAQRIAAAMCAEATVCSDTILSTLRTHELVLVLDGLEPGDALAGYVASLAGYARDCRIVVTSRWMLRVTGERVVPLTALGALGWTTPSQHAPRAPAAALDVLLRNAPVHAIRNTAAPSSREQLQRIAELLDGLPAALEVGARCLGFLEPAELLGALESDPLAFLESMAEADPKARCLIEDTCVWVDLAISDSRAILLFAAMFEGRFSRADLHALCRPEGEEAVEHALRVAIEASLMVRGSDYDGLREVSWFRFPSLVRCVLQRALAAQGLRPEARQRYLQWGLRGPDGATGPDGLADHRSLASACAWFTLRVADVDALIVLLDDVGRGDEIVDFAERHARAWTLFRDPAPALRWLALALARCSGALRPARATLLLERARLLVRLGDTTRACYDAEQAFGLASLLGAEPLRERAAELLRMPGGLVPDDAAGAGPWAPEARLLRAKVLEAGESLLGVARLAADHGELGHALSLSTDASLAFRSQRNSSGLLRALRYSARMAFAMGQTDLSREHIDTMRPLVEMGEHRIEQARVNLLLADLALSDRKTEVAIRLATQELERAIRAADMSGQARAFRVLSWAHLAERWDQVAGVLGGQFLRCAQDSAEHGLIASAYLLHALLGARGGRPEDARQSLRALQWLMTDMQSPIDLQSSLVVLAELAILLDRPAAARRLAQTLAAFAATPAHLLRPMTLAASKALHLTHDDTTPGAPIRPIAELAFVVELILS